MKSDSIEAALVTGASRGIGKGIASALGRQGATVFITGRTAGKMAGGPPGSLEETAHALESAGARCIPVVCDHSDDDQVASLFEKVKAETGRLDLLVNNATALPRALVGQGGFWERSLELADMFDVGLRSTYVASAHAASLMVPKRRGVIASISFYGAVSYFHGPAYGAQKAGVDKMMHDMAHELRPHGVAAISLWPGLVATELVAGRWKSLPGGEERLATYETTDFVGRVVTAIAEDPAVIDLSGQAIILAEYAAEHGMSDIEGRKPRSYRSEMGAPTQFLAPTT